MRTERLVHTIETHTGGMPTRIVTGGTDHLFEQSDSVATKRDVFSEQHDDLRKLLIMEPRGHDDMFGAVITQPSRSEADVGAFFMNIGGCNEDICIHGLIGVVTGLVETGRLSASRTIRIETPGGVVATHPTIEDGRVTSVRVENVPSFVCMTDVSVALPEDTCPNSREDGATIPTRDEPPVDSAHARSTELEQPISVDLVFSGNTFALLDADLIDIAVRPQNVPRLVEYGDAVLMALEGRDDVDTGPTREITAVAIYQSMPRANRIAVVAHGGHVDRSPSGTGTSALMVLQHSRGSLDIDESFTAEGVIGTTFDGRVQRQDAADDADSVVPEVVGSAHVTGEQSLFRDPADPLVGFSGLNNRFATFDLARNDDSR